MADTNVAFVGSIPENYDRYLGPVLFEAYAADLVRRLKMRTNDSVLELACGTGVLTRRLRDCLPANAKLTATDLNEPMMNWAVAKFNSGESVEWRQADAAELPFADESFDAVVCQFGVMFFPDKPRALAEVFRVLRAGGQFLFNVWDSLEHNDLPRVTREVVNSFFNNDQPTFYDLPFSFFEREQIRLLVEAAGFTDIDVTTLPREATARSAEAVTIGLVEGNPIITAIRERIEERLPEIRDAVANTIRQQYGDSPVRAKMQAVVCSARK